jgi:tetratricopeptide (TPR) repeat protein
MASQRLSVSFLVCGFLCAGVLWAPPAAATKDSSRPDPSASDKKGGDETTGSKDAKAAKGKKSAGQGKGSSSEDDSLQQATGNAVTATLHALKGAGLAREGKFAEAEKEYLAADKLVPDNGPFLQQLSTVQLKLGRPQDALATLERAIRRGKPFDDKAYLLAARVFTQIRAFVEGEKKLIEWAADRPITANFHAAVGLLRMATMELGPAEIEYHAALKMDPGNEAALTGMSELYGKLNSYPKLQPFLDRGLAAKPDSVALLVLSGNSLLRQERYAEAKQKFEKVLKLDPRNAAAQVNLGSVIHSMGDAEGAIESFRKAMELDPKSVEAPVNLAIALEMGGRNAEARNVLIAARKRGVDDLDVLNALAVAHGKNHEIDAAMAVAEESLARDPSQGTMRRFLEKLKSEKSAPAPPPPSDSGKLSAPR